MALAAIDRRLAILAAIALPLVEAAALYGFLTVPLDVGYPPGASTRWIALGTIGIYVHFPLLLAWLLGQHLGGSFLMLDTWPHSLLYATCFAIGFVDLLWLAGFIWFIVRALRKLVSSP